MLSRLKWVLGLLGFTVIPAAILLDAALAIRQGWQLEGAGGLGRLVWWLSFSFLTASLLLCMLPSFRRLLAGMVAQFCALSISIGLSFLVAELFLAQVHPQPAFHTRQASARYRYEPDPMILPGVFGPATASINRDGLRATEMPIDGDAYRILCVGGSGTECLFLDDKETWPALLMANLNQVGRRSYWVGTAAVSEMATGDHLRFIRESRLIERVECLVVMPGGNDFLRLALGMDMGGRRPPVSFDSNIMGLLREIWNVKLRRGVIVDRTGEKYAMLERGLPFGTGKLQIRKALNDYAERLDAIIATARRRGVRLVFCTQPVLWDDFLTTLGTQRLRFVRDYPGAEHWAFTAGECRAIIDQYNAVIDRVGADRGVEVIDAASKMDGMEVYFYDDFHLNERGCAVLANLLTEWFLTH